MQQKADSQLVKIVEYDFKDFSLEAVNAAKNEILARNLSEEHIHLIKTELEKTSRITLLKDKVTNSIVSADELYKSELGVEQSRFWYLFIILLVLLFICPLILVIYNSIKHGISFLEIPSIIQFILFSFILQRCIQKKKIGWIFTLYFCMISILLNLFFAFLAIKNYIEMPPREYDESGLIHQFHLIIDYNPLRDFASAISISIFLFLLLWIQSKQKIRSMFKVDVYNYNFHIKYSFLAGLIVTVCLFFISFYEYF